MSNKDASHDNAASEGGKSAGQRASGGTTGHDAPGCCGAMMAEMMKTCHGDPAGTGEAPAQRKAPGFLGRLGLRMMESCCGDPAGTGEAPAQPKAPGFLGRLGLRMMKSCCGDLSGKAPAPSGKN